MTARRGYPLHTAAGILIAGLAQAGVAAGLEFAATWLTPLMWTGYIFAIDGLVYRLSGSSWLTTRRREAPFLFLVSVGIWLLFEAYNFHLRNWAYVNVPPDPIVRDLAYAWSFATIAPAVFETADLAGAIFFPRPAHDLKPPSQPSSLADATSILVGLALVTVPLALPAATASFLFGAIWIGFIFLIDPVNGRLGTASMKRQWQAGDRSLVYSLLLSGAVCGLLWETWNFEAFRAAGAYWVYLVPEPLRIFGLHFGKMPILGLLGFPPFAIELHLLYSMAKSLLGVDRLLAIEHSR
jgi:hypothetical protein